MRNALKLAVVIHVVQQDEELTDTECKKSQAFTQIKFLLCFEATARGFMKLNKLKRDSASPEEYLLDILVVFIIPEMPTLDCKLVVAETNWNNIDAFPAFHLRWIPLIVSRSRHYHRDWEFFRKPVND